MQKLNIMGRKKCKIILFLKMVLIFLSFNNNVIAQEPQITSPEEKTDIKKKVAPAWLKPLQYQLNLKLAFPLINLFYLNKGNGYGTEFGGIFGISSGNEVYITNKLSVSLELGASTNMLTLEETFDDTVPSNSTSALFVNFQLGSDFSRFHYDIGLQWNKTYHEDKIMFHNLNKDTILTSKKQSNYGFSFSTYFKIYKALNVRVNYFPSFVVWDENGVDFHYSHLLFLEFLIKFNDVGRVTHKQ